MFLWDWMALGLGGTETSVYSCKWYQMFFLAHGQSWKKGEFPQPGKLWEPEDILDQEKSWWLPALWGDRLEEVMAVRFWPWWQLQREERFILSRGFKLSSMVIWLWCCSAWNETGHHGWGHVAKGNDSLHSGQEAERGRCQGKERPLSDTRSLLRIAYSAVNLRRLLHWWVNILWSICLSRLSPAGSQAFNRWDFVRLEVGRWITSSEESLDKNMQFVFWLIFFLNMF